MEQKHINYLLDIVGKDNALVDNISSDYWHDEMMEYGSFEPEIVLFPKNTAEVSSILKYANEHLLSVTTRGAGTGLCGGCVSLDKGIILCTTKMNKIIEIDTDTLSAVLEPGVLLMDIISEADKYNLLYAPDPGEKSATVGGNVMTNAGGMRAVKYGVTRDYVKGMEVVLASGEIINLGGKISKNSSGYSLKDLMIGSEGTLGVVTKIYMKLIAKPKKMISLLMAFDDLNQALSFVPNVMNLSTTPTTIEFMEKEVIDDATEFLGKEFPNKEYNAYLIVSYSGNSDIELESVCDECSALSLENKAIDVFISDTQERQDSIWNARGAFLEAIKNSTSKMDECDVVVSINKVAAFCDFARCLSKENSVRIRSFGHAGDGNLHIYICKDDMSDELWNITCKKCMDALYQKAIELNGQVSGEHGIGHAKKAYLKASLNETQMSLMKGIKKVFDPNNILNAKKIID